MRRRTFIPSIVMHIAKEAKGVGTGKYILDYYNKHGHVPVEYQEDFYNRVIVRENELNFDRAQSRNRQCAFL